MPVRCGLRECDLDGEVALRRTDIGERRCARARETARAIARLAPRLSPDIAARKPSRRAGSE